MGFPFILSEGQGLLWMLTPRQYAHVYPFLINFNNLCCFYMKYQRANSVPATRECQSAYEVFDS